MNFILKMEILLGLEDGKIVLNQNLCCIGCRQARELFLIMRWVYNKNLSIKFRICNSEGKSIGFTINNMFWIN